MPLVPLVNEKLKAISWKMKKIAIVTTTNVCRRTRSAIKPTGRATPAATSPASGSVAKITFPFNCSVPEPDPGGVGPAAEEDGVGQRDVAGIA